MKTVFSKRFAQIVQESNLTYDQVAQKIGICDRSTICKYINGGIWDLKISRIESIANAFGVNPAWLCGFSKKKIKE